MKKLLLIALLTGTVATTASAGPYICGGWQVLSTISGKIKRHCVNPSNQFDQYWEVCTPRGNNWSCHNAGSFEPSF